MVSPGPRYEVEAELAQGGMGRILLARDRLLQREVAIKTLLQDRRQTRLRFLAEARITGRLAHPNVVPVHELAETETGEPFLVMKRVQGRTLGELIRSLKELDRGDLANYPLRRRLRLLIQVAETLAFAHAEGVIHRDVKPSNVMLGRDDQVLVMDWGLALERDPAAEPGEPVAATKGEVTPEDSVDDGETRLATGGERGTLTAAGAVLGTPAYMAPEQARSAHHVDARADVYSLGAVLYELITLEPPYHGGLQSVLEAAAKGPPPPPSELVPGLPRPLDAIVAQAMARDPDWRYGSASELAEDLKRLLDGRTVTAYEETAWEAARRLGRQHRTTIRTLLGSLAVLALVLAGTLAAVLVAQRQVGEETDQARQAADQAEREAEQARLQAARAGANGRARGITGQAGELAEGYVAVARQLRPLGLAPVGTLSEANPAQTHSRSLSHRRGPVTAELIELERELHELRPAVDQVYLEEVRTARERVDQAFVEAALGRWPSRLLPVLAELELEDPALTRARALYRLGDSRGALQALEPERRRPTPRAQALVEAVAALAADRPLREQLERLERAVELAPDLRWLVLWRGQVRARLGQRAAAEADFEAALAARRLDSWALTVGFWELQPAFTDFTLTDDRREALARLGFDNLLIRLTNQRSRAWGRAELQPTINLVGQLGESPRGVYVLAHAIQIAWAGGFVEQAGEWIERLLARDPDHRVGLGYRALDLHHVDKIEESLAVARRGLERYPDDRLLLFALGVGLNDQGQHLKAIPALLRAAESGISPRPWLALALACARSQRPEHWDLGITAARRAIALAARATHSQGSGLVRVHDPRANRALARFYANKGELARAAVHAVRAHLLSRDTRPQLPTVGNDLLFVARLHLDLGLPEEADDALRELEVQVQEQEWTLKDWQLEEKQKLQAEVEAARAKLAAKQQSEEQAKPKPKQY